jgi:hypothetical protein
MIILCIYWLLVNFIFDRNFCVQGCLIPGVYICIIANYYCKIMKCDGTTTVAAQVVVSR